MKKCYTLLLFSTLTISALMAQQLPQRSPFTSTNFIWNPALTAPDASWEIGASHRQEWVGFNEAPQTTTIYGQYAVPDQPVSLGGFFMLDQIKPLRTNMAGITYVYKVGQKRRRRRRARTEAQVSLGVMATMTHILFDPIDLRSADLADPLLPSGEQNLFRPNFGVGIQYYAKPTGPTKTNFLFGGAAINQLLNNSVLFRQGGNPVSDLRRALHANANLGYHYAGNKVVIEPQVWLSLAGRNILDVQLGVTIEQPNALWGGLLANQDGTLSIQAGYHLPMSTDRAGRSSYLRVGVLGSLSVGDFGPARGLGYEFYVAYRPVDDRRRR